MSQRTLFEDTNTELDAMDTIIDELFPQAGQDRKKSPDLPIEYRQYGGERG